MKILQFIAINSHLRRKLLLQDERPVVRSTETAGRIIGRKETVLREKEWSTESTVLHKLLLMAFEDSFTTGNIAVLAAFFQRYLTGVAEKVMFFIAAI